jgi:hypothetical protein
MPRVLTLHERVVGDAERAEYLAAMRARRDRANAAHAHFWVFEHESDQGRFVEFIEAADGNAVRAAGVEPVTAALWHEVEMI